MLSAYIEAAMRHATYEKLPNGSWYGEIPVTPGVWANEEELEACQADLRAALEDWMIFRLQAGLSLPTVDGVDIQAKADVA